MLSVRSAKPRIDAALGMTGLHEVREKVAFQPLATLLPPDPFRQYADMSFWQNQDGSRASVITAKPAQT